MHPPTQKRPAQTAIMAINNAIAAPLDPLLTDGKLVDVEPSEKVNKVSALSSLSVALSRELMDVATTTEAGNMAICAEAVPSMLSATSAETVVQTDSDSVSHPWS